MVPRALGRRQHRTREPILLPPGLDPRHPKRPQPFPLDFLGHLRRRLTLTQYRLRLTRPGLALRPSSQLPHPG